MENLGKKIKSLRLKKGLTQHKLAEKLFVTKQAVSKWENNRGSPDISILQELANIFDISIDELLGQDRKFKFKMKYLIFSLALVISVICIPFLKMTIDKYNVSNDFYIKTEVELPPIETYEIYDFYEWEEYGNRITVKEMSYYVLKNGDALTRFENSLLLDFGWMSDEDQLLLLDIPEEVISYYRSGDYFVLLSTDRESCNYNNSCTSIFLIYQQENRRLLMFEFY